MSPQTIIEKAYNAFNNRDINGVLSFFDKQVEWPNGWEGGYVHGHDEVKNYWTRQWAALNPMVYPMAFKTVEDNRLEVKVKQVVKNLSVK